MTPTETKAIAFLEGDLVIQEGTIPYVYPDQFGFWTIGNGFLVDKRKGGKLYPEEIQFILHNRALKTLAGCQNEAWYPAVANDPVRLAGVLNMQYQLGSNSDEKFVQSFDCIGKQDWKNAAIHLRDSLWAKQTPNRAEQVIAMIETGKRP